MKQKHTEMLRDKRDKNDHKEIEKKKLKEAQRIKKRPHI